MRGGYERAERKLLAKLIVPGDKVIELGASLGIVTSLLAKKVGPNGSVAACEPNGLLKPHFRRQLEINGVEAQLLPVLACPLWAGPVPEEVSCQKYCAVADSLSGRADGGEGERIPWRTLSEVAAEAGIPAPTALVIDVEGGEKGWCAHAPGLPSSVRTVIVEIHPHIIGEEDSDRCVQALVNDGFSVVAVSATVFGFQR